MCTNTVGSYYCSCLLGYTLSANGTSCDGELIQLLSASNSPETREVYFILMNNYLLQMIIISYSLVSLIQLYMYILDINECASNGGWGPCQQMCTNTVGSYYCSCLLGYTVSANGASCNGEHSSHMDTILAYSACHSDVWKCYYDMIT